MRDFYVVDPLALLYSPPTPCEFYMAILPPLLILMSNLSVVYLVIKKESPIVSLVVSGSTLLIELITIAFRHHPQYVIMQSYMQALLWMNMVQVIVAGLGMSYLQGTIYLNWMGTMSILMILVTLLPFVKGVFIHNPEAQFQRGNVEDPRP